MAPLPQIVLASGSPRRRELLAEAGYDFIVIPASDGAECGVCDQETPPQMVHRLALQKARDVAERLDKGLVVACDTVAAIHGRFLGKPRNDDHAREMLQLLRGREHFAYSGLCVWPWPTRMPLVEVATTKLRMANLTDDQIEEYLATGLWEGKAGAFGYQDRLGWLEIVEGSESNVVGLPLELLADLLRRQGYEGGPLGSA
ncbi:MAG TPA: Maf family protein [Pirellulales bacterium]